MQKLNPYAKTAAALEAKAIEDRRAARKVALKAKQSKAGRAAKSARNKAWNKLGEEMSASFKAADKVIEDEIKAGRFD